MLYKYKAYIIGVWGGGGGVKHAIADKLQKIGTWNLHY